MRQSIASNSAGRMTGLTTMLGRGGEVVRVNETVAGAARTVGYTYDGLRRLAGVAEAPGSAYAYAYDRAGNRTGVTRDGAVVESRAYDAADQVVGWAYDGAGQLLDDGAATYAYDPLGRLASATRGGATAIYAYNGDHALAGVTANGVATRYTLDTRGGLSERLGATTNGASTWYVRGWGQELARERGGATAWLLPDRLGSVRGELDAAGAVAARHDYDPYGTPEGTSAPADYGYAGEPRDGASGLVHLRARWYAPGQGRFLSRDPWAGDAGAPQTLHPYAYAHNDPMNGTDPTGWARLLCGDGALGGAAGAVLGGIPGLLPFRPDKVCIEETWDGWLIQVPCDEKRGPQPGTKRKPIPVPVPPAIIEEIIDAIRDKVEEEDDDPEAIYQFADRSGSFKNGPSEFDHDGISVAVAKKCGTPARCLEAMFNRLATVTDRYRETTKGQLRREEFIIEENGGMAIPGTVAGTYPLPHASVTHQIQSRRPNGSPQWSNGVKKKFNAAFSEARPVLP